MRTGVSLAVAGGLFLVAAGAGGKPRQPTKSVEVVTAINGASCVHRCATEFCRAEGGRVKMACITQCLFVCGDEEVTPARDAASSSTTQPPPAPVEPARENARTPPPAVPAQAPLKHTDVAAASRPIDSTNPYGP